MKQDELYDFSMSDNPTKTLNMFEMSTKDELIQENMAQANYIMILKNALKDVIASNDMVRYLILSFILV